MGINGHSVWKSVLENEIDIYITVTLQSVSNDLILNYQ